MKKFFGTIWSSIKGGAGRIVVFFYASIRLLQLLSSIVVVGGGYWGYTAIAAGNGGTEYVLAAAVKGPLSVTVTGSGQVSANDQLALTPQASGQVDRNRCHDRLKRSKQVKLLHALTAPPLTKLVQSAQSDLTSAQISYQQTLTSSQTSLSSDQTSVNSSITSAYNDLPAVMTGFDTDLHGLSTITGFTAEESLNAYANYVDSPESIADLPQVEQAYTAATASYQQSLALYNATTTSSLELRRKVNSLRKPPLLV